MIRYLFLVLLTAGPASAQTAIAPIPIFIRGVDNPGWSGCSFNTLKACQAATSGAEAECLSNAWYQVDATAAAPVSARNQIGANAPSPDP